MNHPSGKYILLFYNMWGSDFDFNQLSFPDGFFITTDHAYLGDADAVIFHMPSLRGNEKIRKPQGQLWVFWSMECEAHHPLLSHPEVLSLFDIFMTYKSESDVQVPYLQYEHAVKLRQSPLKKKNFVNAFISSSFNLSKRSEYLSGLMSLIAVDSYGKSFNNRKIENDKGFRSKMDIISSYKFTLAFENAIVKDYVTEKFFDPLMAGSVPVYLGAPNIEEFAPGEKCYINASLFGSVNELAEYLLLLNENDSLYQEYLLWKERPFKQSFIKKIEEQRVHPFIRLCSVVKEKLLYRMEK